MRSKDFNLEDVKERFALSNKELECLLFPDKKAPGVCLKRLLNEDVEVDMSQLRKIAEYKGVSVSFLIDKRCRNTDPNGFHFILIKGDSTTTVNFNGDSIITTCNGKSRQINCDVNTIGLSEFLSKIEESLK